MVKRRDGREGKEEKKVSDRVRESERVGDKEEFRDKKRGGE